MIRYPTRRAALLLAAGPLAGCSVLPERPYHEVQRFALAPERPERATPPRNAPVLLVRTMRAAPGLDVRGLRMVGADGQVSAGYWQEWAAPPADLAEEALRRWLGASGRFSAVILSGSRLRANFVLEGELIRLQAEPAAGLGRAALSVLLLAEPQAGGGDARILGQFLAEGSAPIPGGAQPDDKLGGPEAAAAMSAALAQALAGLERTLAGLLPARR
jgi:cholesterol transport system auxiliary component